MQKIAICDDEVSICASLEALSINVLNQAKMPHEVDVFTTGAEIYQKLKQGFQYDLIFLDINLTHDEINGIEFAHLIRKLQKNNLTSICFISWEKNYALSLFDVQPLNFLVKPLEKSAVEKVIYQFITLVQSRIATLNYKISHEFYKRPLGEILYLESQGRKIAVHLMDGKIEYFYGKLKDIYPAQLQQHDFLFIHGSLVVNYDCVKKFSYEEVTLINEKILPISQANRTRVRAEQLVIEKLRA